MAPPPAPSAVQSALQVVSVIGFLGLFFGVLWSPFVVGYILFYTQYWWLMLLYIVWIYFDDAMYTGKRGTEWARNWAWWRHATDYFPVKIEKTVDLDPARNYFLIGHPHGILPFGGFLSILTNPPGFRKHFPSWTVHTVTLNINLVMPFIREVFLLLGFFSANESAIKKLLGAPGGGKIVGMSVGGAAESFLNRHDANHVLLKKRRGFCRLSLMTGTPLVPCFSFGDHRTMDQVHFAHGSLIRRFQEAVKARIGVAPILIKPGLPTRLPLTVVVGGPVEIQKIPNPTRDEVDELHRRYSDALEKLYNSHKKRFYPGEDVPLYLE